MTYCAFCEDLPHDNVHKIYHDTKYGFPIDDDNELFGRLLLEINQAGLSWDIILKKEPFFREAYSQFDIQKVARYTDADRERLLSNPKIVRNRLKVNAAIHNAQQIERLQEEFGSFINWLDLQAFQTKEQAVKLFKKQFKFTGGEIVNEFLMSIGYLKGAHNEKCIIFEEVKQTNPKWLER